MPPPLVPPPDPLLPPLLPELVPVDDEPPELLLELSLDDELGVLDELSLFALPSELFDSGLLDE